MTNLRELLAPIPRPPAPSRLARLTHRIRCNDRIRVRGSVRACSVCGQLRTVR